jgi:copper chaperone CopZ
MKTESLIRVTGMTCGSCVRHVGGALRKLEGVGSVDVRLEAGEVLVAYDSDALSVADLLGAIQDEGYGASSAA